MAIDPNPPVTYYGEQVGTAARLPVQTLDQDDFLTNVSGPVTAVQMEEGTPKLVVNGYRYNLSSLQEIYFTEFAIQ
jgi:hypothetical protein